MPIDRRAFLLAAGGVLIGRAALAGSVEEDGLFWIAATMGKPTTTMFGYARTAASAAPALVQEGEERARPCGVLVTDIPNVRLPLISINRNAVTAIASRVPTTLAARLSKAIDAAAPAMPTRERLSGLEVVILLQGEGETPPQPSVGGTIAEALQKTGQPFRCLLTPQEYVAGYSTPDLAALDRTIDADVVAFLLDQRDRVGPLGRYQEKLYVAQKIGDLARFTDDLRAHGVPSFKDYSGLAADRVEALIVERSLQTIQATAVPQFVMVPVAVLTGEQGVLARGRAAGLSFKRVA